MIVMININTKKKKNCEKVYGITTITTNLLYL